MHFIDISGEKIDVLEILSLPIQEHGVSSYVSICIYFPQQYFTVFSVLHILCQVYAKVFYIGWWYGEWYSFWISTSNFLYILIHRKNHMSVCICMCVLLAKKFIQVFWYTVMGNLELSGQPTIYVCVRVGVHVCVCVCVFSENDFI